jgi:hypothetical protein
LIWKNTDEARALVKAITKMQAIVRRQRARREAVALCAKKSGMLLALPGTIQGESGWYESGASGDGKAFKKVPAMIVQYKVSEEGDWIVVEPPITRKEWMATREGQVSGEEKARQQQRRSSRANAMAVQQKEGMMQQKEGMMQRRRSSTGQGPSQQEAVTAAVTMMEVEKSSAGDRSAPLGLLAGRPGGGVTAPLTGAAIQLTT